MDAQIGKLSPSRAYSIVKHEKEIIRKRAEAKAFARELELPYKFTPLHADSTKFEEEISELRDSSVDLILTDPPYANGDESLAICQVDKRYHA
jgi:16S rRNA G966 N2-methylase RsmD